MSLLGNIFSGLGNAAKTVASSVGNLFGKSASSSGLDQLMQAGQANWNTFTPAISSAANTAASALGGGNLSSLLSKAATGTSGLLPATAQTAQQAWDAYTGPMTQTVANNVTDLVPTATGIANFLKPFGSTLVQNALFGNSGQTGYEGSTGGQGGATGGGQQGTQTATGGQTGDPATQQPPGGQAPPASSGTTTPPANDNFNIGKFMAGLLPVLAANQKSSLPYGSELQSMGKNALDIANQLTPAALANMQGQIGGPAMQSISDNLARKEAQIRQTYSTMGMSGSTAEAQDLNGARTDAVSQQYELGRQMASSGFQAIASETGIADTAFSNLMQAQMQKDLELQNALADFTGSFSGNATSSSGDVTIEAIKKALGIK